jgi:hypothetical protein
MISVRCRSLRSKQPCVHGLNVAPRGLRRLTTWMSCRQKWRSLCSSSCKGSVAFGCQLHPTVRRRLADRNETRFAHLVLTSAPAKGSTASDTTRMASNLEQPRSLTERVRGAHSFQEITRSPRPAELASRECSCWDFAAFLIEMLRVRAAIPSALPLEIPFLGTVRVPLFVPEGSYDGSTTGDSRSSTAIDGR